MKPIVTDTYYFPTLIGDGYVYYDTLNSRVLSLVRQRPGLRRLDLMAALKEGVA